MARIQIRRDTDSNWANVNPTLLEGELGYETNTGKFKIGDGVTEWVNLAYFSNSAVTSVNGQTGDVTVFDGDYNNLANLPDLSQFLTSGNIPGILNLDPNGGGQGQFLMRDGGGQIWWTITPADIGAVDPTSLAAVATSGDYNDLLNLPTLFDGDYNNLANLPDLSQFLTGGSFATVATSGDYNDLTNLPTLFDGDYNSLANLPNLSTVAISGLYADLPDAPVLATVATSGDYNDLTNLPNVTSPYTLAGYNNMSIMPVSAMGNTVGANAMYGLLAAGITNTLSANFSFIGSGISNQVSDPTGFGCSVVLGGTSNTVSGGYSAVLCGRLNTVSASYGAIGGGLNNKIEQGLNLSIYSVICGGNGNIVSNDATVITGGQNNHASGYISAIGGGWEHTASGSFSVIGGGYTNTASGSYSVIGGGATNTASGYYSSVLGGHNNDINNQTNAHIIGSGITADAPNTTYVNALKIVDSGAGVTFPDGTTQTTAASGFSGSYTDLTNVPADFTPSAHTHTVAEISDFPTEFTPSAHTHTVAEISDFPTLATVATSGAYDDLTGKPTFDGSYGSLTGTPTEFAPSAHTHTVAEISDFPTEFTPSAHTHTVAEISDFPTLGTAAASNVEDFAAALPTTGNAGDVLTYDGSTWTAAAPTGGNPFDQDLNTTNDVTFNSVTFPDGQQTTAWTGTIDAANVTGLGTASASNVEDFAAATHSHTVADISDFPTEFTPSAHTHTVAEISDFPTLATVATSGDYTDLSNRPTFDGSYGSLTGAPDLTVYVESSSLATVATSGDYNDLSNLPNVVSPYEPVGTNGAIRAKDFGNSTHTVSGSFSAVLSGYSNTASANQSVVVGGVNNSGTASGYGRVFIGGGDNNNASSEYACVVGGKSNTASGSYGYSFVGGGNNNTASGSRSGVVGGKNNTASGEYSAVGGGRSNVASGIGAVVAGGGKGGAYFNTASGNYSFVGGGYVNTASGTCAVVVGGGWGSTPNTASGPYSFVGCGTGNTADSIYSSVLGGYNNHTNTKANAHIIGSYISADAADTTYVNNLHIKGAYDSNTTSLIGGSITFPDGTTQTTAPAIGRSTGVDSLIALNRRITNTASGAYSMALGGISNSASGGYSVVCGGYKNSAAGGNSWGFAFVGGGVKNTASGYGAVVVGGGVLISNPLINNQAGGTLSFVGGGLYNTASGFGSVVVGGGATDFYDPNSGNTASGKVSAVLGGTKNTASGNYSSILGGQNNNTNNKANAHIIGSGITADAANTAFVNALKIVDSGAGITFPDGTTQTTAASGGGTTVVPVTYASTLAIDASAGDIFDVTLTGSTLIDNPTNPVDGKTIRIRILQDATGNRAVTLGSKFKIPASATSPLPFSTAANAMDILAATYHAGRDKWDVIAFVMGY